jgi:A/G-specific adenine glycosylase
MRGLAYPPSARAAQFRRILLQWYGQNQRRFAWRETSNPYEILLAEVLLQRTQANQVADHYADILTSFPVPGALAEASLDDVRAALQPLGLSKRALTLKSMAQELMRRYDGRVPSEIPELITLPGVGRYIASAVACFVNGARIAVVDANVIRLLTRFFGFTSGKRRVRDDEAVWSLAQFLLPRRKAADYNRALIDFATSVCRPGAPLCVACPLRPRCCSAPAFLESRHVVAESKAM